MQMSQTETSLQHPLIVLKTAQASFDFAQQELGEFVDLPWYCNQSKALELLINLKSYDDPAVDPAEWARAIAQFYLENSDYAHPELNSYKRALLKLIRAFFEKQEQALLFMQCLTKEIPLDNYENERVGSVIRCIKEYLEAGNDWLKDYKFEHTEIPCYR